MLLSTILKNNVNTKSFNYLQKFCITNRKISTNLIHSSGSFTSQIFQNNYATDKKYKKASTKKVPELSDQLIKLMNQERYNICLNVGDTDFPNAFQYLEEKGYKLSETEEENITHIIGTQNGLKIDIKFGENAATDSESDGESYQDSEEENSNEGSEQNNEEGNEASENDSESESESSDYSDSETGSETDSDSESETDSDSETGNDSDSEAEAESNDDETNSQETDNNSEESAGNSNSEESGEENNHNDGETQQETLFRRRIHMEISITKGELGDIDQKIFVFFAAVERESFKLEAIADIRNSKSIPIDTYSKEMQGGFYKYLKSLGIDKRICNVVFNRMDYKENKEASDVLGLFEKIAVH